MFGNLMKINLFDVPDNQGKVGGGWTFLRNFKKGMHGSKHVVTNSNFDISMACGATMVSRDLWEAAQNKPRVLRADGVPEDFRNRGTGWSRMRDYGRSANLIIYQSQFSKDTTGRLIGKKGPVILNGVDTDIFNLQGPQEKRFGDPSIIFVHFRCDPNKRFQEVIEHFRQYKIDNPKATITFVGDYPKQQVRWNQKKWDFGMLDLVQDKDWRYVGIVKDRNKLARFLRSADFIAYPSFADPCPNTLIESLACGCKPLWLNEYGSSLEIVNLFKSGYDFSLNNMITTYLKRLRELL
jgi:glycosyltransferase involved in cell wall biosynthesis